MKNGIYFTFLLIYGLFAMFALVFIIIGMIFTLGINWLCLIVFAICCFAIDGIHAAWHRTAPDIKYVLIGFPFIMMGGCAMWIGHEITGIFLIGTGAYTLSGLLPAQPPIIKEE